GESIVDDREVRLWNATDTKKGAAQVDRAAICRDVHHGFPRVRVKWRGQSARTIDCRETAPRQLADLLELSSRVDVCTVDSDGNNGKETDFLNVRVRIP